MHQQSVRNVLVIAYYFPPLGLSGVQRTLKFVKYLPQFGCTFAQLSDEKKNANSHRGKAAQQMLSLMRERWFAPLSEA